MVGRIESLGGAATMTHIAFIGLGNMGGPMAANLVAAGHRVQGFDLSTTANAAAAKAGVTIATSGADAVAGADVVVTMLPAGRHVQAAWGDLDACGNTPVHVAVLRGSADALRVLVERGAPHRCLLVSHPWPRFLSHSFEPRKSNEK